MAKKEYIERAATLEDENYKIEVTTLAPMKEMDIGESLKTTGKQEKGKEYSSNEIRSDMLKEGMTIIAEDTIINQDIQH